MFEEAERNKNEDKEITIYLYIMPDDLRSTYSTSWMCMLCFEGFLEEPASFVLIICSVIHQHLN
jgi:hypothetical protein